MNANDSASAATASSGPEGFRGANITSLIRNDAGDASKKSASVNALHSLPLKLRAFTRTEVVATNGIV